MFVQFKLLNSIPRELENYNNKLLTTDLRLHEVLTMPYL